MTPFLLVPTSRLGVDAQQQVEREASPIAERLSVHSHGRWVLWHRRFLSGQPEGGRAVERNELKLLKGTDAS